MEERKRRQRRRRERDARPHESQEGNDDEPRPDVPAPPDPDHDPSLHGMPAELLLKIVAHVPVSDRISLAQGLPEVFLKENYHLYNADANDQWIHYGRDSPPPEDDEVLLQTFREEDYRKPLLMSAIEKKQPLELISQIVDAYVAASGDRLSNVFLYRAIRSPLELAIDSARPDVVRLLIERGFDPFLRHGRTMYRTIYPGWQCVYKNILHEFCRDDQNRPVDNECFDTLIRGLAIYRVARFYAASEESREELDRIEECFMAIQEAFEFLLVEPDGRTSLLCNNLIGSGLDRLLRRIIEGVMTGNNQERKDRLRGLMPSILQLILISFTEESRVDENGVSADRYEEGTPGETARFIRFARRDDLIRYILTFDFPLDINNMADIMDLSLHSRVQLVVIRAILYRDPEEGKELLVRLIDQVSIAEFVDNESGTVKDQPWVTSISNLLRYRPPVFMRLLFRAVQDDGKFFDFLLELHADPSLQTLYVALNRRDDGRLQALLPHIKDMRYVPAAAMPPGIEAAQVEELEDLRQENGSFLEREGLYDQLARGGVPPLDMAIYMQNPMGYGVTF
ncbi:hypothetical protein F5Y05DRAFT_411392 [Hypoxylon sp. FL0543]|nr:hypothetical protein F5Y05DRAFT_411392 [Hypoxylon sp. FL0543]